MPAVAIAPSDLAPLAKIDDDKAQALIDMALARAARVAPCINDPAFEYDDAAKQLLIGTILRWNDAGSGAVTNQQAGPFGQTIDTRQRSGYNLWPSEITELASLCGDNANAGKAYEVDTMPPRTAGDGYWSAPDTWTPA